MGLNSRREEVPHLGEVKNKGMKINSELGFWEFHRELVAGRMLATGGTGEGWKDERTEVVIS